MGNIGNAKLLAAFNTLEGFGTEYTKKHVLNGPIRKTVNTDLGKIIHPNAHEKTINLVRKCKVETCRQCPTILRRGL